MTDYYATPKSEIEISPLMQELRKRLTKEGLIWKDASEEFGWGDYKYHIERTKVLGEKGELASCIYGFSGKKGDETGITYGYPGLIECMSSQLTGLLEPEPMAIEQIVGGLKEVTGTKDCEVVADG